MTWTWKYRTIAVWMYIGDKAGGTGVCVHVPPCAQVCVLVCSHRWQPHYMRDQLTTASCSMSNWYPWQSYSNWQMLHPPFCLICEENIDINILPTLQIPLLVNSFLISVLKQLFCLWLVFTTFTSLSYYKPFVIQSTPSAHITESSNLLSSAQESSVWFSMNMGQCD